MSSHFAPGPDDIVLDALPESVAETVRKRDKWAADRRRQREADLEFVVSDVQRWTPGRTVRVAFLGGNEALHSDIEDATRVITEACNLTLDFRNASGGFRTWSEADTDFAAEIRVSFDLGGYFSLVGTDSINTVIGRPQDTVGGRPGQRSLNLGGFTGTRPPTWRGTTRHEFLHALSFHHSHQNMRGPCEQEFRWEDDPGYQPTRDTRGVFVADAAGRRPGIYTYLSGPPNEWPRSQVDHNLRSAADDPTVVAGPFDPASVMLYRFPAFFYKSVPSGCAPTGDGIELSAGDRRGLQLLYPHTAADVEAVTNGQQALAAALDARTAARNRSREGLESAGGESEYYERATADTLRRAMAGHALSA